MGVIAYTVRNSMGADQSAAVESQQDAHFAASILAHCKEQRKRADTHGHYCVYMSHAEYSMERCQGIARLIQDELTARGNANLFTVTCTDGVRNPRLATELPHCELRVRWDGTQPR